MYNISDYTSDTIKAAILSKKNIILPLGAIEAHSDYLPLGTDIYLAEAYGQQLAAKTDSLLMPVLPYGQVWSLMDAPGSLHIKEVHLIDFIVDLLESLTKNGLQMVTVISSHFGNLSAMKAAARKVYGRLPIKVLYFTYPGLKKAKELFDNLANHAFYLHADEVETSLMLHVKPSLVNMTAIREGMVEIPETLAYTPMQWTEFTTDYIIGDAKKATADKGAKALEIIIEAAAKIILTEKNQLKG